ncbi:glyoxalase [Polymorphobacter fuscus]|uniref:Glyoxalase n=1 Tax=Sandarakinorhabdus fusca TaxID=1439888 RepID=A0A7C9KGI0_9SPHN|nr:glyoxalase [Polymorphobacter fuscus]KAB7649073.1 glyoxalase [Polymorphobacter fuscus]MQT16100.1 glyoxalase [Polymorphobacter fuscus]
MRRLTALGIAALVAAAPVAAAPVSADFSVGPQYDTTHVYVAPADFDAFTASLVATFGGTMSKQGVFQVTPTPSQTMSQLVLTPAGTVSVFGFKTPVPYPFGAERTGYLVTDLDSAVAAAIRNGATRVVVSFPDPIGRDAVVQWPGGVNMQLYWHTAKPSYPPLASVPENRIHLTADAADGFVRRWLAFSRGRVVSDDRAADGAAIGQPGKTYRRIALTSGYGRMLVMVSDGQLPWPYGRELTGYEVADLPATLAKAGAAGVETLVPLHADGARQAVMLRFPGGYIAEVHSTR